MLREFSEVYSRIEIYLPKAIFLVIAVFFNNLFLSFLVISHIIIPPCKLIYWWFSVFSVERGRKGQPMLPTPYEHYYKGLTPTTKCSIRVTGLIATVLHYSRDFEAGESVITIPLTC